MSSFQQDANGRNCITVENLKDHSKVTVYEQGAHITSWRSASGEEHLYLSPQTVYKDNKAIRGGSPLIFPQFSDIGTLSLSHGFARVRNWALGTQRQEGDKHVVEFEFTLKPGQEESFPDAHCTLVYTITFTNTMLNLGIAVKNLDEKKPLEFAFAFHTYFAVDDVRKIKVGGLDETKYLDNLQKRKECPAAPIHHINKEVDRIYANQGSKAVTVDNVSPTTEKLTVEGKNFKDTVLWNGWVEKTKGMADMPDDGYLKYVCIESGIILEKESLPPLKSWSAAQHITVASKNHL